MNVQGIELANVGMQTYFDIEFLGPFQQGIVLAAQPKSLSGRVKAMYCHSQLDRMCYCSAIHESLYEK
ncbi:hypothetical protein DVQ78_12785 [Yersinia enterocolitica]|nr:hypothetical protein [Yersinia enterocolitica]